MTICFTVLGNPVPKQSFRVAGGGRGFQPERVKDWEELVSWEAAIAMQGLETLTCPVKVTMDFYLSSKRRVDCDNLVKGTADPMTHAGVWQDDSQIVDLHVRKHFVGRDEGRVVVIVDEYEG